MAYNTKQSCEILKFMKDQKGEHLTAQDIVDHFRSEGINIGTATVYRRLDRLTTDGLVNKYIIDDKSPACYEYIGTEDCCHGNCYHMKCEVCGKLLHLSCDEINKFFTHISSEHGFILDPKRTVFYGTCASCAEKKA
ncbi:MAG: transcriptional repressor [Saccharofermentans sp.]|nr:transcriptional repressor [Saccharofermentans sp.]